MYKEPPKFLASVQIMRPGRVSEYNAQNQALGKQREIPRVCVRYHGEA